MDLSIIIPVYNTDEKTIERCFLSIQRITGICYECLLIDDGSQEKTAIFCEKYASEHAAFRYIRKENGGVSSARNLGIRESVGRFICFVDSDDEIVPEAYNILKLHENTYDVIFTDLMEINGNVRSVWRAFDADGDVSYETAVYRLVQGGAINGPVCKLIRREFLEKADVWFPESMIHGEDAVFFCKLLCNKPRMHYCAAVSYLYYHSYTHGNQRFINAPLKCIENAAAHNEAMMNCIEMGAFSGYEAKRLRIAQNKKYMHELFSRAMDSIEYNVYSEEFHNAVQQSVEHTCSGLFQDMDVFTMMKYRMLTARKWTKINCIEKVRSRYHQITKLRQ